MPSPRSAETRTHRAGHARSAAARLTVAVLTGGSDSHYAIPLVTSLSAQTTQIDVLGSDEYLNGGLPQGPYITVLNVYANKPGGSLYQKARRLVATYSALIRYAARSRASIFHILWLNKIQFVDRVLLLLYFKTLRKTLVFTAHNVDAAMRDGTTSAWGRWTLRFMYRMMDHIFVHTDRMKAQLQEEIGVQADRISVIPFGLNTVVPDSGLTRQQARATLGLEAGTPTMLFFGNITPYKGVEYLLRAVPLLKAEMGGNLRVIIAGRVKDRRSAIYFKMLSDLIGELNIASHITSCINFIPDNKVEAYFKSADVCVLPYTNVFQTGVMFLAYRFGIPVVASDVGSIRVDLVEGKTGFVCQPEDPADLAAVLHRYFQSDLYANPERTSREIRAFANDRYGWQGIAQTTFDVYCSLSDAEIGFARLGVG